MVYTTSQDEERHFYEFPRTCYTTDSWPHGAGIVLKCVNKAKMIVCGIQHQFFSYKEANNNNKSSI